MAETAMRFEMLGVLWSDTKFLQIHTESIQNTEAHIIYLFVYLRH